MKKLLFLSIALIFVFAGCLNKEGGDAQVVLTQDEAKAKAESFINDNLMQPGTTVTIDEITEEMGLYKVVVNLGNGQKVDSYITKDGGKFFPQVLDVNAPAETDETADPDSNSAPAANITPSEKPMVELFVMSHCPFGTQIEKGILPVLETLGSSIDFELKFCTYAMHDKKELDEQLVQHCIKTEEPEKLQAYLKCFLDAGDGEKCLTETGINKSKNDSCVSSTDKEFKVTEGYNDKSTWSGGRFPLFNVNKADNEKYGVSGSPTLVVNGTTVSGGRDSASLLSTICGAFIEKPDACNEQLSSASPSAGFGYGTTGAATDASCE